MIVKSFSDLLRFVNSDFECAYELIALFIIIKFKDDEGGFDMELVVDFFMELYSNLETIGIRFAKGCDPAGNRENVRSLLEEKPIENLLESKILTTPARIDFDLFKEIFNNEEAILVAIKNQLIQYYLGRGIDSRQQLEMLLFSWEAIMNEMMKTNSLMRITEGSYNKFTLEFLLKFLYQSYSLGAFEQLVTDHQINQKELLDYFQSRLKFTIERVGGIAIPASGKLGEAEEEPEILREPAMQSTEGEHVKSLIDVFHQMREESLEEGKKKKKKK